MTNLYIRFNLYNPKLKPGSLEFEQFFLDLLLLLVLNQFPIDLLYPFADEKDLNRDGWCSYHSTQ